MIFRSPSRSSRDARLSRIALALLLSFACALQVSCGGGEEEKAKSKTAERNRSKAEKALAEAKDAGVKKLFKDDFEKYEDLFADAESLFEDGDDAKASKTFSKVRRSISKLIAKAEKAEEELKELEELDSEVKKVRRDAASKARADAPKEFASAEKKFEKFRAMLKDPSKAKNAERAGQSAIEAYQDAVSQAERNATVKKKAMQSKESMLAWKQKAKEVGADETPDWLQAERQERNANTELGEGQFYEAQQSFDAAESAYNQSFLAAKTLADLKAGGQGYTDEVPDADSVSIEPEEGESFADAGIEDDSGGKVGEVEIPEDDPIDPGSPESLIESNLDKIALGIEDYDPITGQVTLDYTFGAATVKKEFKPLALKSKKFLDFWSPMIQKDLQKDDPEAAISFTGNTEGAFLLPAPLKAPMTIEWNAAIQVMDNQGSMGPIFAAQDGGKKYFWADFSTFKRIVSKRSTKKDNRKVAKKFKRSANYWFNKTRDVKMRLDIVKDEKKEGRYYAEIWYDLDEDDGERYLNRKAIKEKFVHGMVGWRWFRTKFFVKKLRITAQLDKDEALKILKQKLGIDATETGSTSTPKKTRKTSKSGGKKVADAKRGGSTGGDTKREPPKEPEDFDF